jgi:hypothetical protein
MLLLESQTREGLPRDRSLQSVNPGLSFLEKLNCLCKRTHVEKKTRESCRGPESEKARVSIHESQTKGVDSVKSPLSQQHRFLQCVPRPFIYSPDTGCARTTRAILSSSMNNGGTSISGLKSFLKSVPVVGPTAAKLSHLPIFAPVRRLGFSGSAAFWESTYRQGETSGPGSYGRLAEFKAEVLNDFVRNNSIQTIIEFGCGDGAQLQLASYPEYVGVDVARTSVKRCSSLFAGDASKRFYLAEALPKDIGLFDLALSLDVIYHLVENSVFDKYMRGLFSHSRRYVVIYSSNQDARTHATHVRHRKFTAWIEKNVFDWRMERVLPNRFPFDAKHPDETSHSDFYFFVSSPSTSRSLTDSF